MSFLCLAPEFVFLFLLVFLQSINKELRDLKTRMQSLLEEKDTLSHEYQDLTKKKAKVELTIKDILEEIEGDKRSRVS